MPPRRAKAKANAPTAPSAQKRRAEDASASQKDAPPAKKARQSAPKAAPKKIAEVIEVSSDSEAGSEDDKVISSQKKPAITAVDSSDSDSKSDGESVGVGADEEESEEGEEEDGSPRLPRKVRVGGFIAFPVPFAYSVYARNASTTSRRTLTASPAPTSSSSPRSWTVTGARVAATATLRPTLPTTVLSKRSWAAPIWGTRNAW